MKVNNSFFYNKLYNNNWTTLDSLRGCPETEIVLPWIRRRSFHLPNGILFTFHLQYTNLTKDALGISF